MVLASTVLNLAAYDPAFAYEVATIIQDGIAKMFGEGWGKGAPVAPGPGGALPAASAEAGDIFYYLTLYNESYPMPAMPDGAADGIIRGIYRFAEAPEGPSRPAVILFSGTAQGAARAARQLLAQHHDVAAELWSVTSYKALREEALAVERSNRLHPTGQQRSPHISEVLVNTQGPTVAVTDFMKAVPDQVARWVPGHFTTLGTDGYGRSDTRVALRRHFETDAGHIVVAVLQALADIDEGKYEDVADAIIRYDIDADATEPPLA